MRIYHKAYVYLTCGTRLLVFNEPENPEIGLQVPGGTIDPGESYLIGAKREFVEETGLELDAAFEHFADQDLPFDEIPPENRPKAPSNRPLTGRHIRKHYHVSVGSIPAEEWEHYEMTPSVGGPPIRFRLFWIDLFSARAQSTEQFFAGFGEQLDLLRTRVEGAAA